MRLGTILIDRQAFHRMVWQAVILGAGGVPSNGAAVLLLIVYLIAWGGGASVGCCACGARLRLR